MDILFYFSLLYSHPYYNSDWLLLLYDLTSQKKILEVKNTLDSTVNSAIKAADELAKIPAVLRKVESLGVSGKPVIDNGADLGNYVTQLMNLDSNSKKAAKSLVVLDSSMKSLFKQDVAGLQSGQQLNAQLFERTLATTSLTSVQQKQILTDAQIIDAKGRYVIAETSVVEQNILSSASFKALSVSEQAAVKQAIADTTAKQAQTGATVSLTAAQSALNVALSFGKQALIGIGIGLFTWGIQKAISAIKEMNPTMQELTNRAQEAKTAYQDTQTTLNEYKSKLEEINDKKALVREGKITDPAEIAEIENQNTYIDAQIKLYEELLEKKAAVANANAWEAANKKSYTDMNSSYSVEDDPNGVGVGYDPNYVDPSEHLTQLIDKYNELSDSLANLSQEYQDGEGFEGDYDAKAQELSEQMADTKDQINNVYDVISNNFNNAIDDGSDKFNQLKEKTDASTEAYMNFQNAVDGAAESQENLNQATSDDDSWKVDAAQELSDFMSKLSDSSSDLYAKTKALTSAYNDMYQNQKLSSDSIQSLVAAYPDLINQLETENGVTKISKDLLCEKFDAMKGAMVATIESEIQATQTAINQANARISVYQHEIQVLLNLYSTIGSISANVSAGTASGLREINNMSKEEYEALGRYQEAQQGIEDMQKTIEDANKQLADQKKELEVLNNLTLPNYAGATKGTSGANKGATKAAKENKKALEAQKKEAEKTQKALEKYSKTLKAQGDAVIDILDKRKDALEKEQKAKDKAWDKEKEQLQDEKDLKDKAWDKEKEQLKEEKELQDDIYDKQKKALKEQKELQDKVYQKQIDDLKDKKQALQDANDEEDRAIKLAQLQDTLEQAKSQRTKRVYQHDTGFEWQTDESAVSDAQNALDDQQRAWRREDAIAAVEKEIEAVENLKDAYDEQIEAEIDGIDKAKDAYDEKVEAQIDAIEKAKDAFDEMIEDRIDQIEKAKDAYDEMIEGETEKLDEMKEKWQDVMDLIGMSWEDYQAKIAATAQFQNMTLDGMGQYLGGYKDEVIKNMQDIAAAEAEVQRITDELSGLDTSSGSSGGGGGGGGTGIGTGASVASGFKGLSDNLKQAASEMQGSITELQNLKDQEEALKNQIDDGNLTTSERIDIMTQLSGVQAEIKDKENDLNEMSANYIITLGEESDATDEYRSNAIEYLQMLNTEYGANYEEILQKLNQHVQDLQKTNTSTSQEYDSMGKTVEEFANSAGTWIDNLSGNFDSLAEHVRTAASDIVSACATAKQELENINKAQAGAGSSAIGSRSIQRAGYYHIDESGPEIVVHDGKPGSGRYTYMERGGEILPASFSKNLWDMGSNPGEWFERQYSKFNRMDNSKATYAGSSTVYSPTFTGDIVISNPIANSDDLARGLKQNLPASFMQAIGVRM